MPEQQSPAEYAWIKPGVEARYKGGRTVFVASDPFDNGGYWMVLIKGDNRPVTLTIPVYCSDVTPADRLAQAVAMLREARDGIYLGADEYLGVIIDALAILEAQP